MENKPNKEHTFSKRQRDYKDEKERVFDEAHKEYQKKVEVPTEKKEEKKTEPEYTI